MIQLPNAVCLVTGGTQGIGWAIAQALAARGGRVYACGRTRAGVDRAAAELAALPWRDRLFLTQCDVTDRAQLEGWIDETAAANGGRIDILVNNAAFVRWADVTAMSVDEAALTMRVAYDGMVVGVKRVLPLMQANGRGHIVNVGSIAGRIFVGGASAAYAAAKAAIDAYTQTLQVELAPTPVRATLVRLGTVAGTDFFKTHVSTDRMPPLTRLMPALTPPVVAAAVVDAITRQRRILTLPRYLGLLTAVYQTSPRLALWLSRRRIGAQPDYGSVSWRVRPDD